MADDEEKSDTKLSEENVESEESMVAPLPSKSKSASPSTTSAAKAKSSKVLGFVSPSASPVEPPAPVSSFDKVASQFENFFKSRSAVNQANANVEQAPPTAQAGQAPQTAQTGQAPQASQGGALFERRSPFSHNPPRAEERRERIANPRNVRDYMFNLREDLADFQETHGLPRSRDYSFLSLTLALAQETGRALYAVFIMITELFPVLAILSLILRFILDKLIEILETRDPVTQVKKSVIFAIQLIAIVIPVYITIGTIIAPLLYLVFSIFRKFFRLTAGRSKAPKQTRSTGTTTCGSC